MSATTSSTTPPPSTPSPSATSATTSPDLPPAPWPPGLREAYRAYELALAANDLPALANAFGEYGVRVDPSGMAAGAEAVAAFRSARNGGRMRIVERVEVREVAPGVVLTASATRTLAGEAGFHTQVWRSSGGIWRIAAAHVTPPAAALDRRIWRVAGSPLAPATSPGPLDGVRVAVKDVFAVAGVCRGLGNPVVAAEAAPQPVDAAAVAALRAIGAEVTGVATTDEFAYSLAGVNAHTGAPPNLAAPGHLPGGSSSGPAAAVALGQADLGLGTDTAGSIRVPASYQGLWGLRTTLGTVDASGLAPLAPSFDTVGWLTRDVSLLRRVVGKLCRTRPVRCRGAPSCPPASMRSSPPVPPSRSQVPWSVCSPPGSSTLSTGSTSHRPAPRWRSCARSSASSRAARRGPCTASGSRRTRVGSAPTWPPGSALRATSSPARWPGHDSCWTVTAGGCGS